MVPLHLDGTETGHGNHPGPDRKAGYDIGAVFAYLEGSYRDSLLENSDFLFPIVHPYWAGITDPRAAVDWTAARYRELVEAAIVPSTGDTLDVILKEVGLPSGGGPNLNEENQARYYDLLQDTEVIFFYFEAFDQPWKDWEPEESHWGLFESNREPKEVVGFVCGNRPPYVIEEPIRIVPEYLDVPGIGHLRFSLHRR